MEETNLLPKQAQKEGNKYMLPPLFTCTSLMPHLSWKSKDSETDICWVLKSKGKQWKTEGKQELASIRFSLVVQSCPTVCDPRDSSKPGFPVHDKHLEPTQTHIHRVGDAIQLSHPLPSAAPPVFTLSQHQGLFQWVCSSHQVAKVLEFQLQHQSFQWIIRTDFFKDWLVGSPCSPRD